VCISVIRQLKKGRQNVQFRTSATDGADVDYEDGTKNSSQTPNVKQVFEIGIPFQDFFSNNFLIL